MDAWLELEEVDKMLRRDGHEAAFWVIGCAWMATVLKRATALLEGKVEELRIQQLDKTPELDASTLCKVKMQVEIYRLNYRLTEQIQLPHI